MLVDIDRASNWKRVFHVNIIVDVAAMLHLKHQSRESAHVA